MTTYTHHAAKVLVHLAATPEPLSSIGDIARAHGISHNNLMKVVNDLRHAGFVEAVRGRAGGIRLSRPAQEITLGELVRHTEKTVGFIDEGADGSRPPALTNMFDSAFGSFFAALDGYSVGDLAREHTSSERLG
jgi:Rrf2 family nitric oxide-sensitive transcriptional repressor